MVFKSPFRDFLLQALAAFIPSPFSFGWVTWGALPALRSICFLKKLLVVWLSLFTE